VCGCIFCLISYENSQMREMDIGCIRMYSKPWIFVVIPSEINGTWYKMKQSGLISHSTMPQVL